MTELFIRRPVMTTLVMAAILLFGILGYRNLPVSDLPNVDFPTILVTASLPGASPETVAASVATPLEKQFSTIAGLESMNSTSGVGLTQITLTFVLDRNIDAAAQDVQAMITKAAPQLPSDMPAPPSYQKVNPADQPVLFLALPSPTLPLFKVDEYAQTFIAQRISMISGVAQVQVFGTQKYAVRVRVDPDSLAARGIGIDEVKSAIEQGNVNLPTGVLQGPRQAYTVESAGQLMDAAAYRPLVVAYRNGSPVRLADVGHVLDGVENDKIASWFNDTRAIVLAIQRQPGTNTVEVVNSIRRILPVLRAQIPASVDLTVLYDRSASIRESVQDVKFTLLLAVMLVVMVIFLFLRNVSATIIPSLALPFSIVGTFSIMYLLGYSLDNMSLMALTLAVGFVVDDAIVMLENIVRHMEQGKGVLQAALEGSKEIGFTIMSMTISLVVVFIPVLFMGGVVGRLLHEFAVTISAAILVSGVVSLSLTPMLCSKFLKPHGEIRHGNLFKASERAFAAMVRAYDRTLTAVLKHRLATMLASFVLLGGTAWLFVAIPKGFLPNEDTGAIFGFTEAAQGISFEDMARHQQEVSRIVRSDNAVWAAMSSIGPSGPNVASNSGRIFLMLKPHKERKTANEILQEMRPKLGSVTGVRTFLQILPPIRIGGQLTKSQYQLTLQSPDTDELYALAPVLEAKLREIPGLLDVTSDLQIANPQINVAIDRDRARATGLSARQIEDALFSSYGSRQVSTIFTPTNAYKVILELDPRYQEDPASLSRLHVRSSNGALVPLSAVTRHNPGLGPLLVNHLGQLPSVTISFNLKPEVSLGEAVAAVDKAARAALPATITTSFQGTAQAFQASFKGMGILLLMAILVIYIVLGILYESFIHPLTILSGLPSAGFGALAALMLFKMDLNLYGFVGVILLVGIVKKNAIMMIDFALDAERKEGKHPQEAIHQGCLVRFRPIMMTTMSALMATLPIAIGFGAGSESRQPMGIAVMGGLVFSQLITLYLTPVVYVYLDQFQRFLRRHGKRARA